MEKRVTCGVLSLLLLLLCLPACRGADKQTDAFYGMGTPVSVTLYGTEDAAAEGFALVRSTVAELDSLWSLNRTDSDISRLNRSDTGISDADGRTAALIGQAVTLSAETGGCFDVTLAALSALWQKCGEENRLPTEGELAERLAAVGTAKLRVDGTAVTKAAGQQIDLGAVAKGAAVSYLTDRLSAMEGLSGGLISMGSCVGGFGEKPDGSAFRVSVRDPQSQTGTVGTLSLSAGQVLSVSGDYERFVTIGGRRYHHILDPKTGYPTESGLSSVAVITQDGATADALSTAFMVMGEAATLAFYRAGTVPFEAVLIRSDGTVVCTDSIAFSKKQ